MWEWIQAWTFFNWLALVAFVFGCLSVTNAFLGLKSRWKDWRALKSKDAFNKRLAELELLTDKIKRNRESKTNLYLEFFSGISAVGISTLWVAILVILSDVISFIPITFVFSVFVICLLLNNIKRIQKLKRLADIIRSPRILFGEIIQLLMDGSRKGYITNENYNNIQLIIENDIFTERDREFLRTQGDIYKDLNKSLIK